MKTKRALIFAVLIFLGFNLLFNFQSWIELTSPKNEYNTAVGDSTLTEFILENNYQLLIQGKNPFILENKLFYPFDINVSLNDPGFSNVIFFFILRPFLGIHESMLIVVLLNIFLANLFMYMLLKKLKINNAINTILALSYGFMPVIAFRVLGHYTYTSIYIFPLVFLIVLNFIYLKNKKNKIKLSLFIGILLAFTLLLNFYYFLAILIALSLYIGYFLFFHNRQTLKFLSSNIKFFILSLILFLIVISPWALTVINLVQTKQLDKAIGFGGAVELSGDLAGFFTPSEFNPIYYFILKKTTDLHILFTKYFNFYLNNKVKFIYPGLIILMTYFLLLFYKNKISKDIFSKIRPHLYISLIFATLLLGPFLKIFNKWIINLDGVGVVIPMPFLILHYLPGLGSLRAPTRFLPIFVFLALVVSALVINYFYSKLKNNKRNLFIICLFFIFVFDQLTVTPPKKYFYFPLKIYNHLKTIQDKGTVLEIPFTVRDGFQYMGFVHAIGPMNGHLIHNKPIIGGYFARVPQKIFDFYKNKKFINYVSKIIDKGNYDPTKELPNNVNIYEYPYSIESIEDELESLNIKYIILKNNEEYSRTLEELLLKSKFIKSVSDNEYDLFIKRNNKIYGNY